jgi:cytochrome c oxidase assembly protein subunit 15
MSLGEFKTIFWWEWSHRLLGRVIGVAYLLPFLWFIWRGDLGGELKRRLWLIFALGALQGAVGWWMVASGLSQRVEVAQERLAVHLTLALVILAAIVWTLRRLDERPALAAPARLRVAAMALLGLTFVQIFLGALVAGLRAGKLYNTWPEIDGALIPSAERLWFLSPWWRNFLDNHLTVQFDHRMLAYALWALAIAHAFDAMRVGAGAVARGALWFAAALTLQAALGVSTLLYEVPIALALAHQAVAVLVLTLGVVHLERVSPRKAASTAIVTRVVAAAASRN